MEIGIKVVAENPKTRHSRHVMSSFFTMVAVDEKGNPVPVPALQIETEDEQWLFEAAKRRIELRKDFEKVQQTTLKSLKKAA